MKLSSHTSTSRVAEVTVVVGLIPWLVFTGLMIYLASGDVDLSWDSEGLPIVTQVGTFFIYLFLWAVPSIFIFLVSFIASSVYYHLKAP